MPSSQVISDLDGARDRNCTYNGIAASRFVVPCLRLGQVLIAEIWLQPGGTDARAGRSDGQLAESAASHRPDNPGHGAVSGAVGNRPNSATNAPSDAHRDQPAWWLRLESRSVAATRHRKLSHAASGASLRGASGTETGRRNVSSPGRGTPTCPFTIPLATH